MERFRQTRLTGISPVGAPHTISGVGLLILTLWIWYGVTYEYASLDALGSPGDTALWLKLLETAVLASMSGALVYAGYWFGTGPFTPTQQWWGAFWTITGAVGIVAVVVVVNAHQLAEGSLVAPHLLVEEMLLGAAGGGIAGVLIGLGTAQSMRQAEQVAKQRDAFAFLNKLLRHDILNNVTIIKGLTDLLGDDLPDEHRSDLRTIEERSETIADLTRNVSEMARVLSGEASLEPVDLSSVLRSAVETAERSFGGAEFESDIPEGITVRANQALENVFDNLLTNAVEHNDADRPRVVVSADASDATVRVTVADNGPGVPDDRKAAVFEPTERGDHGMGLYLVKTIVSHYGGEVRVTDNEPAGAAFTVELPNHSDPADNSV